MEVKGVRRRIVSRLIGGERIMCMNIRGLGVLLFVLLLFAGTSLVQAVTYEYKPVPRDLYDLDHWDYYAWGIDARVATEEGDVLATDLASGGVIDSARLVIRSINDWTQEDNDVLHIWLVDELPDVPWWSENWPGVSRGTDNQGTSDIFEGCDSAGIGTHLMDWTDPDRYRTNLTVNIPVAAVTSYILNDGMFGLALDPDCHYYNRGLKLTINTSPSPPPAIPEPMTMIGVITGVGALSGYLRRRRNIGMQ